MTHRNRYSAGNAITKNAAIMAMLTLGSVSLHAQCNGAVYGYQRSITVNSAQVTGTLITFPMYVSGSSVGANLKTVGNGGHVQNSNGYDVIFVDGGGSALAFELVGHGGAAASYVATTGAGEWWVNVASMATGSVVYMCYGAASVTTYQGNDTGTWNSSFVAVLHHGTATTLSITDSTGINTPSNTNGSTAGTGKITGGVTVASASSQVIDLGTNAALNPAAISYVAWFKPTALTSSYSSVIQKVNGGSTAYSEILVKSTGKLAMYVRGDGAGSCTSGDTNYDGTGTITLSTGTFYHLALTYDTGTGLIGYANGAVDGTGASKGVLCSNTGNTIEGNGSDGTIDELEISNGALTANWIAAQYNNQSAPGTFYTVGAETPLSSASMSLFPATLPTSQAALVIRLTGTSTTWGGTTVFTASGVSGTSKVSQVVYSTTSAAIIVTTGSTTGTLTITETVTGSNTATSAVTTATSLTGIQVSGVSNTQGLLLYTAPDTGVCQLAASESSTLSPLIHDVDPALFAGAAFDDRSGVLTNGRYRSFPVGSRLVGAAVDGNNYSRAAQAFTPHFVRVACGAAVGLAQFTTKTKPVGTSLEDIPPVLDPTIDQNSRTTNYIDPRHGTYIKPVSLPVDTGWPSHIGNLNTSGPYMYSGGMFPTCGSNLITPASGPSGYFCAFPQGDGGQGVLYFIVPSTGEARFLGFPNWSAAFPNISPTNGEFYYIESSMALKHTVYTGDYQAFPAFTTITTSTTTTLNSDIPAAIAAFDSRFVAADYGCGGFPPSGDYIMIRCNRGVQDSYGFIAVYQVSTNSIVASLQMMANPASAWCALHQCLPISHGDASGGTLVLSEITPKSFNGFSLGTGPYVTTYTGGSISAGTQTITVAGEPACVACGTDTQVPVALATNTFRWSDNGETIPITTKVDSTHWTVTTTQSHVNGATLEMVCMANALHTIFWNWQADPFGTDTTNTKYVVDSYAPQGGHDDSTGTTIELFENSGWSFRIGPFASTMNQPLTSTVSDSATFSGKLGQCFGDGCKKHPSAVDGQNYIVDYSGWDGAFAGGDTLTPISGGLYKYNVGTFAINPRYYSVAGSTGIPQSGGITPHPFTDISGPGSSLGPSNADNYKMCNSLNISGTECHAGSSAGDWWVNLYNTQCVDATGSTTTYTCPSAVNIPASYSVMGLGVFTPQTTNTGAVTVNIGGLGAVPLKDANGTALTAGAVVGGQIYSIRYVIFDSALWLTTVACTGNQACIGNNAYSAGAVMQVGINGNQTRQVTNGLTQYRAVIGFPTARGLADGSWMLFTINDPQQAPPVLVMMAKNTPFAADSVNRTDFVQQKVSVSNVPATTDNVVIKFGYAESGTASQYYCSGRAETCIAGTSLVSGSVPFAYASETFTGTSCASSCTVNIPAISGRTLYYQIQYRAGSSLVLAGTPVMVMIP